jgi:cell surface protein SprA
VYLRRFFFFIFSLLILLVNYTVALGQNEPDSTNLPYKVTPQPTSPYSPQKPSSNINMKMPSNVQRVVEYDVKNNQYIIRHKIGNVDYVPPYSMSFEEFNTFDIQDKLEQTWRDKYKSETFENQGSLIPKINVGSEAFETIFGSNTIDIKPSGSASLKFGVKISKSENPSQPVELQRHTTFDFKEEIQMSVVGKVGDNLEMRVNYNTESQFDFDNTMNLRYQGKEDDIIQKIEAGDVSLPLTTSLISGSQSLFGILSELKFGNLYVTSVFSQQEGETKTITVEGGAQKSEYSIPAVFYDKNRHFFLAHYFRSKYDEALKNPQTVNSTIEIQQIEVWVTNTTRKTENARNMVAFMDLGENQPEYSIYNRPPEKILFDRDLETGLKSMPDNYANSLYEALPQDSTDRAIYNITRTLQAEGFEGGKDYEKVEYARKLDQNDFTYDSKLGYISLNSSLNSDEVLAVAYKYTYNGDIYQVGEFASDGMQNPAVMYLKLLKGTNFNPRYPNWKLMMKNIYSIGAYQVNKSDFMLEVEYYDDETGTRLFNIPDKRGVLSDSLKDEKFLRLLNLDNYNTNGDYVPMGDGVFDFLEGVTIKSSNGKIIFPMLEPFGGYMKQLILADKNNPGNKSPDETEDIANKLTFQALYDSTQYKAEQVTSKNKYFLSGSYKSSGGSEIFLNSFNIPEGSVKVTAGGIILQENQDYTVDYNMGRVKILNESYLASGTPIKISLESNSMFSIQSKTLMGTHLDYRFNSDFNLGATVMNLTERPLTQKVNMGEEPISNTIWGLNGSYRTDVPFLTRMVDFLPFIETKEQSSITLEGEFAQLAPGHNSAIGEDGNAYIDDFEGSESSIDLRNKTGWVMSSIPHTEDFPEHTDYTSLRSGFNRAKLAWYQIDPIFYRSGSPVGSGALSNLKVYRVQERDIFPNKDTPNGIPTEISTLDLAFYPNERGPYNFETEATDNSAGLKQDGSGKLEAPETRWGGIMRELTTNDFEAQNVEYIQFWLMDPFVDDSSASSGGQLYFHLGNVSEDILQDGRKSLEHGMPTDDPVDPSKFVETQWGRVPAIQPASPAFVNDADLRPRQDVGFDGLGSNLHSAGAPEDDELLFFQDYINDLEGEVSNDILDKIKEDPSNDNYRHFRDSYYNNGDFGVLERYKDYNDQEGNTPVSSSSVSLVGQQNPDVEDINGDFTLNENEAFYEYVVNLEAGKLEAGDFITNKVSAMAKLANDDQVPVNWYQFKIPVSAGIGYGGIQDFKSIRFMRLFMKGWKEPIVLRFARLELVRSEWRKYDFAIKEGGETVGDIDESYDPDGKPFTIATVNIEEHGSRDPVNYVLPPGVDRQQDPSNPQLTQLNEQSMSIKIKELEDGYSKAVFKTINMDMRDYGKMKMYIHAESMLGEQEISNKDISCFVRIGSDFTDNYYEYEVPLEVTPEGSSRGEEVWPENNNMVIDFETLVAAKLKRNDAMRAVNSDITYTDQYITKDGVSDRQIIVKGNPNIATVNTIMIGVRNPKQRYNNPDFNDDGQPKSVEVWVNELRLTDFDEKGGWAATGRMSARLADFGTVSFAGGTTKAGFGSIEQKGNERAKEETNQVDVSTNVELGKFFPKEANIRVPMFLGYSRTAINPEYNPLDQDVKLETTLNDPNLTENEKEDLINKVQDLTERRSINFTNVGVGRSGKGKARFYSPSNLSASYSYSELAHHDVGIKYDDTKNYMGSLNYVYNNQPKNVQPFKKNQLLRKPALRLIGDFNFYYAPQQVSFRTTMNRRYSERLLRNLNNPDQVFTTTYNKNFSWDRQFDIKYNFSKGLKFDFATNTNALIMEPYGEINKENREDYQVFKDSVWNSIKSFGTPNLYNQKFNASYTIPINKIPLLNWVSANARYGGSYEWKRGSTVKPGSVDLRNTIKNTQQLSLNSQFNMKNLYRKIGFLDDLDKKYKKSKKQRNKALFEDVNFTKDKLRFKGGTARRISHNLGTEEEIKVTVKQANGNVVNSTFEIINENRVEVTLERDAEDLIVEVAGKKEIHSNPLIVALEYTGLAVTGLKQISGSVTNTRGTMVAGYDPDHDFSNLDQSPGLPFAFGWQYDDSAFVDYLVGNNMLIDSAGLVPPYATTNNMSYNFKAQYQPIRGIRIDFAGLRSETQNMRQYIYPGQGDSYTLENRMSTGSYNVNIWMLSTAFNSKTTSSDRETETFKEYKNNLYDVAWRLAAGRRENAMQYDKEYEMGAYNDTLFPFGYNSTNPDVAIPAFLAAYTGSDVNSIDKNFKSWKNFRPSWRVKFDGLKKIDFLGKRFRNISISHGYMATFTVANFGSNIAYDYDQAENIGYSYNLGGTDSSTFVSEYAISSFAASEQFVPLFGIDMTWKNNVLTKFEYKKTRSMNMNLSNNQMVEVYTWEYTVGTGYRFDKLKMVINGKPIVSDLNLRADFSIRDNSSITHDLAQNQSQLTTGQRIVTFKFTADYQLSEKLTLQAYYDHNRNNPFVGLYKTANTEFGFRIRFSLAQ